MMTGFVPTLKVYSIRMSTRPLQHLPDMDMEPENEILVVLDNDFRLRHINRSGAGMLGYRPEDMVHRDWFDNFLLPEEGKRLKDLFSRLVRTYPKRLERFENAVVRSDGSLCLVRWHNRLLHDRKKQVTGSVSRGVIIPDVVMDHHLLAREANAARKLALTAFIESQEKERRYLADTLHEQTSQVLTTCKLLLEGEQQLRNSASLDKAGKYIQTVINQLRALTHRFNPKQLTELGLERSIAELVASIFPDGSPKVELSVNNRKALTLIPPDLQLCLFRIAQEQLSNIAQHAAARQAWVHLQVSDDMVLLEIKDDGVGFNAHNLPLTSGIFSMRCRAETHGGYLVLETQPGKGCNILVYLPLDNL